MKNILSLILSCTILTTSFVNTGFAYDQNGTCNTEYVKNENAEEFINTFFEDIIDNQCPIDLLRRHQFIVKDEINSGDEAVNKGNKGVKYAFLPLTWNLFKIIVMTAVSLASNMVEKTLSLADKIVVTFCKAAFKVVSVGGKIVIRVPSSLLNVLTGCKDKKINALKAEIERLKEQECLCNEQ